MSQKNYIVMGAGSDIAHSLINELLFRGDNVYALTMHPENLDSDFKPKIKFAKMESISEKSILDALNVLDIQGDIHGCVNCMGSIILKPAHLTSSEEWHDTLNINLNSSFYFLKSLAKRLMKQKQGCFVFVSSAAASIGLSNHEAIAAAKAGLMGLARSAASTYGERGIRVNTVSPGLTNTKLAKNIIDSEMAMKASMAMQSIKKPGAAIDVAQAIIFLFDNEMVTGVDVPVDGGLSNIKPRPKV